MGDARARFRPVEPPSSDEELQAEGGGAGSSGEQEEEASEQQTQQRHGDTGGRDHNLATSASTEVCPTVRAVELRYPKRIRRNTNL